MNPRGHLLRCRITLPPFSSVSAGEIPDWCFQEMRASAWTDAWCHCSGSLIPSFQTPSAPSCTTSQSKTASYASSATGLFSTPYGKIKMAQAHWFDILWHLMCLQNQLSAFCWACRRQLTYRITIAMEKWKESEKGKRTFFLSAFIVSFIALGFVIAANNCDSASGCTKKKNMYHDSHNYRESQWFPSLLVPFRFY